MKPTAEEILVLVFGTLSILGKLLLFIVALVAMVSAVEFFHAATKAIESGTTLVHLLGGPK